MSEEQCICNVCTCGMHKCPVPTHQTTHYDPNDLLSEYKRDYPAWPVSARQQAGPRRDYVPNSHIPFTGETSNRADFVPHKIEPVHAAGPRRDYVPNSVPFEGESTQHADFPKYGQDAYAHSQPHGDAHSGRPRESIPFEGTTTNRSDFVPLPITPVRASGPQREYVPNNIPFEGESMAHKDFPRYDSSAYARAAPQGGPMAAARESIPFEGETTSRRDFVAHPVTPMRAAGPRRDYVPNSVPFEGESTQHADFPKYGQGAYARPSTAGASGPVAREHIPFTGETSNRADFVPHKIEPVHAAGPRRDYVPNSVPFEGESTQHADFPKYGQDAYAHSQPHGDAHSGRPRESIPFEGTTTNRSDFVPLPITPVRASGPQREYVPNNIPFEGESMAHTSYRPYEIDVCPATMLPPHQPAPDGHTYYSNQEVERVSPRKR
ncbi:uncharacterized protein AMSG_08746 [Thecamonas trahens ATCC 50062]|uniref:Uncharacterized protein n=1 Tax=Thecamonas trahens ATCC 50062 TaxID=461836 RepID=A0A0L0DPA7_THETB|nr:hypothetical protein AMSG_08746 [Thecamonas trahens ATCC 50062]KNC53258.1 hypothetical protein AMSG_08746 [Thecamonas trahens ATCC 50062]|eukprot:XP_013754522.1 hypothetical protein AMSG_08746 [Thecamonas trahens ATCC 50062]